MIKIKHPKELNRLRRLALSSQGLLQAEPFGRGLDGARKAIKHIGYVQIDTISVVERAHHHVFYSRIPNFKPSMTNQMLLDGDIFEYWSHAAALLPIADFRFSLPYKHAIKSGQTHWYKSPDKKLMKNVLARVHSDGPIRSKDLENRSINRIKSTGWWNWKPAKKALEQLYMQGDLMVCNREGFQKVYDISERVLTSSINTRTPSTEEFAAHMIDQQLRCHGLASLRGLTYLRKDTGLRNAVKTLVNDKLSQGVLEQVQLTNGEIFLLKSGALELPMPRLSQRMTILSPFDNAVIQRKRLKALFEYDYQIECYVPESKRKYGYFCLPLLYRGEFVGRMDCKAHRKTKHLEIKSLHFEPHLFENHHFDKELVIDAFVKTIKQFIQFQQCVSVSLITAHPKKLTKTLYSALNSITF